MINKMKLGILNRTLEMTNKAKEVLLSKRGGGYVDSMIIIIISVVIGALLLVSVKALLNMDILPTIKTKIAGLFA